MAGSFRKGRSYNFEEQSWDGTIPLIFRAQMNATHAQVTRAAQAGLLARFMHKLGQVSGGLCEIKLAFSRIMIASLAKLDCAQRLIQFDFVAKWSQKEYK